MSVDIFDADLSVSPTPASTVLPARSAVKALPPDILIRILKYLPICSLINFAQACRRFKVLVYDDELWESHLKVLGEWEDPIPELEIETETEIEPDVEENVEKNVDNNKLTYENARDTIKGLVNAVLDAAPLRSTLAPSMSTLAPSIKPATHDSSVVLYTSGNLLDFASHDENSQRTLSLIPGLSPDPFSQKSRAASTGFARTRFKEIYMDLIPYYLDFRYRRTDSKVFKEFPDQFEQAGMLSKLATFGKLIIVHDSDQINNAIETTMEYMENSALHDFELAYDALNVPGLQKCASLLTELNGGNSCVQSFIQKNSIFFDRLHDPMENFNVSTGEHDYAPMKEFFKYVEEELVKQAILIGQVFPKEVPVFHTFCERVIEDVVTDYVTTVLEEIHKLGTIPYLKTVIIIFQLYQHVAEVLWKEASPGLSQIIAEDLLYQRFEPIAEIYMAEELALVKFKSEEEVEKWNKKLLDESAEARQALLNNANREVYRRTYLSSFRKMLKRSSNRNRNSATTSPSQPSSPVDRRASLIGNSPDGIMNITDLQMMMIDSKLHKLQQLLSLETALQMIHLNKESLRRVGCLVGYPDKMGEKVQETLESIFITLLDTLGTLHIKPGFDIALRHIGEHKPDAESTNTGLAPLVEFFELVHIVDLIQQMIQVYYDDEMCRFVDKHDFLSRCNKEKKRFEQILDESVAAGLNKGIQALMDQAEFILMTEQQPEDFRPANNTPLELKPSKACVHTVQCLESHTKLVEGCADQHTLDVFYQEIGLRFFSVLLKHLKKFVVSIDGGFQVISDLNHYTSFITTLQQSSITPFFIALKEMGNAYIISTATDVGLFIREAERFKGILRAEDVYEFVQMREDWAEIKKEVEKQLFGLKAEDCVVM